MESTNFKSLVSVSLQSPRQIDSRENNYDEYIEPSERVSLRVDFTKEKDPSRRRIIEWNNYPTALSRAGRPPQFKIEKKRPE